jgi:hypothetical protein
MSDESQSRQLCCEGSLQAGEPLIATATTVDVWLLLEHNAAWGAKALPESNLPDNLKTFFNHQLESIPNSRFQFIKQSGIMAGNPRFYVVRSSPENPAIYEFRLPIDDILNLDILDVLADSPDFQINLFTEPLFLVCTNGKRDLSCARYGLPLYQAMSAHAGESAWQTTHLGGHRFAGTMAVLPEGLYYGRVTPDDAENLLIEHRAGRIYLDHFRGRSSYDSPIQAAEHFLREHTGNLDINSLRLLGVESPGENHWAVRFTIGAKSYALHLSSHLSDFEIYESTANTEKSRVTLYRLDEYEPGTANP